MIDIQKVFRSFWFAWQGILDLFRYENNAKVHLLVAIVVIAVGFWLQFTVTEWAIVLTQIGLVWSAEAVNTAIERLCDVVSPGHHPTIGKVKDMAAGAVLILATMAVVVGLLVIGNKLLTRFWV
ncbi:diacylglycerol kinase family protein [Rudanella paleaurantiibacter]|uniref:Diacylglycerol kinase family protein n=1 Tax=Rudanella paleaurantiibacter TaxID=2614655 RepID=A0A7J5U0L2_9BACT|nr:diacylglycerol kinase family protein [Rudanella paleaurantiibacter]KAB7731230.1 diacylglycerol kinase family protein [Rudanella paleaurantiibacter]